MCFGYNDFYILEVDEQNYRHSCMFYCICIIFYLLVFFLFFSFFSYLWIYVLFPFSFFFHFLFIFDVAPFEWNAIRFLFVFPHSRYSNLGSSDEKAFFLQFFFLECSRTNKHYVYFKFKSTKRTNNCKLSPESNQHRHTWCAKYITYDEHELCHMNAAKCHMWSQ